MIPKIIHYCWFGGSELPNLTKKCIKSWKKHLPDYEIIEWNERNFDIDKAPVYVREAYQSKKFAFVSDYVRLYALYQKGGIYMDTDVEVKRPLDKFLDLPSFICFESDSLVSTAVIASEPKSSWIKALTDQYNRRRFILENGSLDYTTNVETITNFLIDKGLQLNGSEQIIDGSIYVFPKWYFSNSKKAPKKEIYAVHHFSASWHSPAVRFLEKFLPSETVKKIASYKEKLLNLIKRD